MDIIKLESLYSLKIYLTKYLATEIALIDFIKIIYHIFIRRSTTTIIFINLLPLDRSTIKSIKLLRHLYIRISNSWNTSYFFYMGSLFMNARSVYLNILLHIIAYYGLVICLLDYPTYPHIARMSCYRRIVYKFKYFEL